ncbi:MAG: hypothetical protein Q4E01_05670 [Actinomycetaceae bacterium]|nr:hypothetical protein [Actinomycetaceae bacterium]
MRVFVQVKKAEALASVVSALEVMGRDYLLIGNEKPAVGDLVITDEPPFTAQNRPLYPGAMVVRVGVDVRLPGGEADLMRIVDTAGGDEAYPVLVFAGICGGVGTTTAAVRAVVKARERSVFVLDLQDDPALRVYLEESTSHYVAIEWEDVTVSPDLLISRLPTGILAILSGKTSVAPAASDLLPLVRALRKAGPVVVDAGKWSRQIAQFTAAASALPVLVGRREAARFQVLAAKERLREFHLRPVWLPSRRRARDRELERLYEN